LNAVIPNENDALARWMAPPLLERFMGRVVLLDERENAEKMQN
jgi:hypothetical protein